MVGFVGRVADEGDDQRRVAGGADGLAQEQRSLQLALAIPVKLP